MNKKGFTLVELLAVIAILSIIITLVATNGFGVFENSKKKIYEENEKAIYEAANVFSLDINHCEAIQDEDTIKTFFDTYDLKCSDYIRIKDIIKRHGINSTNINNLDDLTTLSSEDKTLLSVVKNKGLSNDDETNLKICFDIPLKFLIDNNYLENDGVLEINKMYPEFKVKYCSEIIAEKTYINLEKGPTIDEIEKGINILYVDQKNGNDTNVGDYNGPLKSLSIALEKANDSEQFTIKLKSDYTFQSSETIENNKNVIIDGNNKNMVFNTVNEDFYITNKSNMIFKNIKIKNGGKILKNLSGNLKIDNIDVNNLTDTFLMNNAVVESISNSKFNNNHFELTNEEMLTHSASNLDYAKSIIYNSDSAEIKTIRNCEFNNNNFISDEHAESYDDETTLRILNVRKALCILNKSNKDILIESTNFKNNLTQNNIIPLIYNNGSSSSKISIYNSIFDNNKNFIDDTYKVISRTVYRATLVLSYNKLILEDNKISNNTANNNMLETSLFYITSNDIEINDSLIENNQDFYSLFGVSVSNNFKNIKVDNSSFINNKNIQTIINFSRCKLSINNSLFNSNTSRWLIYSAYNDLEHSIKFSEFKNNNYDGVGMYSDGALIHIGPSSSGAKFNIDNNTKICGNVTNFKTNPIEPHYNIILSNSDLLEVTLNSQAQINQSCD